MIYLQVILIIFLPYFLLKLEKQVRWAKSIVMAYVLGVVICNVFPNLFSPEVLKEITGISIILAIPLMLFPSRVKDWVSQPKTVLLAYGLAVLATTASVCIGWFFFKDSLANIALISGMVEGVYTGGTVNLNAIGLAFNAPNSLSVLLNGYDMALSAFYLLAIFSVLPKLLSYVLTPGKKELGEVSLADDGAFHQMAVKSKFVEVLKALSFALVVLGVSVGISFAITGKMNELFLVFGVSLIALGFSFSPKVRSLKANMISADYLMMVFGFSLGAQANIMDLITEQSGLLTYFIVTYTLMLSIHLVLARIFKIDVDSFLISSTAAVFGPPFIGPVAESLKNRSLIGPGIVVALIGNAVGTYFGIILAQILGA